ARNSCGGAADPFPHGSFKQYEGDPAERRGKRHGYCTEPAIFRQFYIVAVRQEQSTLLPRRERRAKAKKPRRKPGLS
ncbi:MAG: hypothetical protein QFC78_08565, partial [Pseudomonadota bacterium]|nr:hypothetical protein [Pseudomonadota bacterium]